MSLKSESQDRKSAFFLAKSATQVLFACCHFNNSGVAKQTLLKKQTTKKKKLWTKTEVFSWHRKNRMAWEIDVFLWLRRILVIVRSWFDEYERKKKSNIPKSALLVTLRSPICKTVPMCNIMQERELWKGFYVHCHRKFGAKLSENAFWLVKIDENSKHAWQNAIMKKNIIKSSNEYFLILVRFGFFLSVRLQKCRSSAPPHWGPFFSQWPKKNCDGKLTAPGQRIPHCILKFISAGITFIKIFSHLFFLHNSAFLKLFLQVNFNFLSSIIAE